MKKTLLFVVLLFFTLILSGCLGNNSEEVVIDSHDQIEANTSLDKNINNEKEVEVKKFYPKTSTVEKTETANSSVVEDDFIITNDLQAKIYIVDKYNPGICYGAPSPVPSEAVSGMISRNPGMASFVRSKYLLSSDLDVYNKIKQINGVRLEEKSGGSYTYYFTDGQCCVLRAYQGNIDIIGRTISESVTQQATKNNPC